MKKEVMGQLADLFCGIRDIFVFIRTTNFLQKGMDEWKLNYLIFLVVINGP
jgi:hypothetical protein